MYFYDKKISLRAKIIWAKIEGENIFIWARLATLEQQAPHYMCIN
jgi:hypothetical protein